MEEEMDVLKLEEFLKRMKQYNLDIAMTYGSELCVGDMLRQEKVLEDKINKLKNGK